MTDLALFDLPKPDLRTGDPEAVHVLLSDMSYACGGNILTKRGHFNCGAGTESAWEQITCPECRAHGRPALVTASAIQQGKACLWPQRGAQ